MQLLNTKNLIEDCRRGNRKAEKELFEQFKIPMMGVCLRYLKNQQDAEEVLIEGFFNVFKSLDRLIYENEIAFFAWIKRIMINQSLMFLRKNKEVRILSINEDLDHEMDISPIDELSTRDVLRIIQMIPIGYRTVFNLYEVEGYKHHEIAEMLGITVGTSKSQLFKAKKLLKEILQKEGSNYGT
jgi:RNA polymerase sigma-70 factor (ECF subfamily)